MYKKEKKRYKVLYCILFAISALIFAILGGVFASRSSNASSIGEDFTLSKIYQNMAKVMASQADSCQLQLSDYEKKE